MLDQTTLQPDSRVLPSLPFPVDLLCLQLCDCDENNERPGHKGHSCHYIPQHNPTPHAHLSFAHSYQATHLIINMCLTSSIIYLCGHEVNRFSECEGPNSRCCKAGSLKAVLAIGARYGDPIDADTPREETISSMARPLLPTQRRIRDQQRAIRDQERATKKLEESKECK